MIKKTVDIKSKDFRFVSLWSQCQLSVNSVSTRCLCVDLHGVRGHEWSCATPGTYVIECTCGELKGSPYICARPKYPRGRSS